MRCLILLIGASWLAGGLAACSSDRNFVPAAGGAGAGAAGASGASTTTGGSAQGGGGAGADGTGASGLGGATGSAGAGGAAGSGTSSGDCDTDADCADLGSTCVELTPGGFRICQTPPQEAIDCSGTPNDECCKTRECDNKAACYFAPFPPSCVGPMMAAHNVCAADECASDADCSIGSICLPAGVLGRKVRTCFTAACKLDSDCAKEAGASCAPVLDPCCDTAAGMYCVYPSNGCRSMKDCVGGAYCEIVDDHAECMGGSPECPL
jgi:hypothetical protein